MAKNRGASGLQQKRKYVAWGGPTSHELREFHDLQARHESAGTLDQLEAVLMGFQLSDGQGNVSHVKIAVTALEGFDLLLDKVKIIGFFELTAVVINYEITARVGTFKVK